ncbi:DUF6089 family protein [Hymenobacter nivis]|uniref:DUF6089 domain-containing protein n=1 Tax=Hymenobacter nivis TaxID=1850093 RepID=A0A2Z3GYT1_9BACT|nr:DUF6089 family protein [Hymenobacter nivis]AWM34544.1 hypothetical protein DDQ68_18205 [Hymenobacter nivis]
MIVNAFRYAFLACLVQAGNAFFCASAQAQIETQSTSELGLGLGVTNYRGEISPQYQFGNNRPAITAFYRRDVSAPITLRGSFLAGLLRADDANVTGEGGGVPPLQSYRGSNMKGSVLEAAVAMEYNFMDYHARKQKVHFTPYLFIGVGGYYANTRTQTANQGLGPDYNRSGGHFGIAIPAGAGVKYALSQHINLGLEVGVRKTFSDKLDNLGDQDPLLVNPHDNDWYYYSGLSVSYTFYKVHCPPQYKNNKRLLK